MTKAALNRYINLCEALAIAKLTLNLAGRDKDVRQELRRRIEDTAAKMRRLEDI